MKRTLLIVALALGTLGGYGSAIAHAMHAHAGHCAGWHHDSK